MLGNVSILVLVFLAFVVFFEVCDSFMKSEKAPGKQTVKGIISGLIAWKAVEILTRSRQAKNQTGESRSVMDDINEQKRSR